MTKTLVTIASAFDLQNGYSFKELSRVESDWFSPQISGKMWFDLDCLMF